MSGGALRIDTGPEPQALVVVKPCGCAWIALGSGLVLACPTHAAGIRAAWALVSDQAGDS